MPPKAAKTRPTTRKPAARPRPRPRIGGYIRSAEHGGFHIANYNQAVFDVDEAFDETRAIKIESIAIDYQIIALQNRHNVLENRARTSIANLRTRHGEGAVRMYFNKLIAAGAGTDAANFRPDNPSEDGQAFAPRMPQRQQARRR